jgi:two-component system, NtrC family, nitrogen regulation sensor histidine kinase NtrY
MRLQTQLLVYLISIHAVFAGVAWVAFQDDRVWLFAVEAFFALSFIVALWIRKKIFLPLMLMKSGSEFIRESDFTTRLLRVGQAETDVVIDVFNQMLDALREERARLEEQNFFLDKLIRASPSGVILFTFDGEISLVNPGAERLLGASRSTLIGKRPLDTPSLLARSLATINANSSDVITLDGQRRIKCTKSEFIDSGFRREFVMMEELTDELRISEKRAYEKVIRLLSHEVNNSSGAIRSLMQSCLSYAKHLPPEEKLDFENALSVCISRAESLTLFMKNYSDIIKLPAPTFQTVSLDTVLYHTTMLFDADLKARNIGLMWQDGSTAKPTIRADKLQLEQVFINIFKNAMEAIGQNGTIRVVVGERHDTLHTNPFVAIYDSGTGISESVRKNLFTPFFSTKENGQGLGLTLVQEVLSAHRFAFSLISHPNRETCFTIEFTAQFSTEEERKC